MEVTLYSEKSENWQLVTNKNAIDGNRSNCASVNSINVAFKSNTIHCCKGNFNRNFVWVDRLIFFATFNAMHVLHFCSKLQHKLVIILVITKPSHIKGVNCKRHRLIVKSLTGNTFFTKKELTIYSRLNLVFIHNNYC